jgi:hypothetical protein
MEYGLKAIRAVLGALREQIELLEASTALPASRQRGLRDRIAAAKFQEQTILKQLAEFEEDL